jgi:hypothetical protein
MRRFVPWALVALAAVAGLVGALVGEANQPQVPSAQSEMSAIVAATRVAGTARFTYSAITTSSNPLLRSTSYGKGTVDFKTESLSTVEDDRQTSLQGSDGNPLQPTTQTNEYSEIWIGRTTYDNFNTVGFGFDDSWDKTGNVPVNTLGSFGVLGNVSPISELATDASAPGEKTESQGPDMLGTTLTTRYRLLVPTCNVAADGLPREVASPTDLWIDQLGRLVQARSVLRITISKTFPVPKNFPGYKAFAPGPFAGRSTLVSTIRLFDFGGPVAISAPKVSDAGASSSQGIALVTHSHKGCLI